MQKAEDMMSDGRKLQNKDREVKKEKEMELYVVKKKTVRHEEVAGYEPVAVMTNRGYVIEKRPPQREFKSENLYGSFLFRNEAEQYAKKKEGFDGFTETKCEVIPFRAEDITLIQDDDVWGGELKSGGRIRRPLS